jgi:hypothetical protein
MRSGKCGVEQGVEWTPKVRHGQWDSSQGEN